MSDRNLPWQTEAAIVRDVLRWADTAAELSPVSFWMVITREVRRHKHPWVVSTRWEHRPGQCPHREGRGGTPEAAFVDLAYILHKDFGYIFTSIPAEDVR